MHTATSTVNPATRNTKIQQFRLDLDKLRRNPDAAIKYLWKQFPDAAKIKFLRIQGNLVELDIVSSDHFNDVFWVQNALSKCGIRCFGEDLA